MWLINTSTFCLEEFLPEGPTRPQYAILSHRWEEEELSFNQMKNCDVASSTVSDKKGWKKITRFCQLAAERGYQWAWVDTCCIDKSSSAELSEAINSMFQWYQDAAVCMAYLCDVQIGDSQRDFHKSDWFNRGWTLQELVAPLQVEFYDCTWAYLGDRRTLCQNIFQATHIPVPLLYDPVNYELSDCSVAQRMSWVAHRQTSRGEDMAYSLMGLFDVHMPLLYGEGLEKAFYRLQLEILQNSDDETIFCWEYERPYDFPALASIPKEFGDCREVRVSRANIKRKPYSMTNKGLQIELSLRNEELYTRDGSLVSATWYAPLNCTKDGLQMELRLTRFGEEDEHKLQDFEGRTFVRLGVQTRSNLVKDSELVKAGILIRSIVSPSGRLKPRVNESTAMRGLRRELCRELLQCSLINKYPELSILDISSWGFEGDFSSLEGSKRFNDVTTAAAAHLRRLDIPSDVITKFEEERHKYSSMGERGICQSDSYTIM